MELGGGRGFDLGLRPCSASPPPPSQRKVRSDAPALKLKNRTTSNFAIDGEWFRVIGISAIYLISDIELLRNTTN